MGRNRLRTNEEKQAQVRLRMRKYYERHRDIIKRRNLERYYRNALLRKMQSDSTVLRSEKPEERKL